MRLKYGIIVGATETFRWAMYCDPHGRGLNAQTMPKALRYYLTAPEGRIFVAGDLSQAEARVVAYLSACKSLIELFNDPRRHVHSENAIAVFGHPVEKDSPEYTLAKGVVHASNYREGPRRLSSQIGLPAKQAKVLLERYHAARPEIRVWHQWVWHEIKTKGMLVTPLGDERVFYEAISCFSLTGKMTDQHWKDAIAWVPQTVVPHVLDLGLLEIARLREGGLDVQFHHQGHDSFLCSVPEGHEVAFFDLVHPIYSRIRLAARGGNFVIPQEYNLGYSFGDMFPYTGSVLSRSAWEELVCKKLAKKSRAEQILEGTYGALLKDWRP